MSVRPVILVEWLDSCGPSGDERWKLLSAVRPERGASRCVTVGMLVGETPETITLAGWVDTEEWSDGDLLAGGYMTIPLCCIVRRVELGEVSFTRNAA